MSPYVISDREQEEQKALILETPCDICNGRGGGSERGQWYPCGLCGGSGWRATEEGKVFADFVRHQVKAILHEMRVASDSESV